MGVEYGALNKYSLYGQPSLDLVFTGPKKSLRSRIGNQQVEFTRGSTATYTDESGIIRTAAQDEARFDHDSDGNSLGLLIEESRTNLITYSETTTANWARSGGTTAVDLNESAVGIFNGVLLTDGGNTLHTTVPPSISLTSGTSYTVTAFIKYGTSGQVLIKIRDNVIGDDTFVAGSPGNITATREAAGTVSNITEKTLSDGVTQITFTISISTTSTNGHSPGIGPYSSDNSNITVYGMQIEAGSFPTSYIPTSGSTVTRSADVASITGTNFSSWYNQSEGTFTLKTSAIRSGAIGILLGGISNTVYGEVEIARVNNEVWFVDYLTSPFRKISHDVSVGENRISGSYDNQTAQAIAVNGTVSTTSQNFNTSTNVITGISLMRRHTQNFESNGHISRLTYYPVRLPDATLQALTA
jgi:hypothetical protein